MRTCFLLRHLSLGVLVFAGIFSTADLARATDFNWVGDVDANWSINSAGNTNWLGDVVPGIAGADSLIFDDGGTGNFSNNNDFAGASFTGVSFAGANNVYTLGGNAITIGSVGISNGSSNIQTVNLPVSFGATTSFVGGAGASSALVVNGVVTNTAASGNIVLTLQGTGIITDNFAASSAAATVITPNAAAANWTIVDNATSTATTLALGQINIISGALNFGTATSAPNFTITAVPSDHTVGNAASPGTFNMVNGNLLLKTRLNSVNGDINISGGNLQVWNQLQETNGANTNIGSLNMTGGTLDVRNSSGSASTGGTLFVASRGTGTLNISNGSITCGTLDVSRGAAAGASNGVVNLNGGILTVNNVNTASANESASNSGSTATFNFNGGTLRSCKQCNVYS